MPNDNIKVAAYLRDSGGSDQDLSVDQQLAEVSAWCDERGLTLTRVFADRATPGSSTVGRIEFQNMVHHFHAADVQESGLVLWKFSRFSRDIDDAQYYRADLRRRGISIYSIKDNIPDSSDGRIYEALLDWMNTKFLEDMSVDVKRGLQHVLREYGAMPGKPPTGFRREPVNVGNRRDGSPHIVHRWVPDPDTWELCKTAWQMKADGFTTRAIHQETHLLGSMNSYPTFFRNRIYVGELVYGDIVIPNYVEPMITREMWETVREKTRIYRKKNHPHPKDQVHPRRAASSYLLSGMLHCLRCGGEMWGNTVFSRRKKSSGATENRYYECVNAHRYHTCDARMIPAAAVERLLFRGLREYVIDPAVIQERDNAIKAARVDQVTEFNALRNSKSLQLEKLHRQITNLARRIAEDEDPPRSLIIQLKDMETQEKNQQEALDQMTAMVERKLDEIKQDDKASEMIARVNKLETIEDIETKRIILKSLIKRMSAERDGKSVRLYVTYILPGEGDSDKEIPPDQGGNLGIKCASTETPLHTQIYSFFITDVIKHD